MPGGPSQASRYAILLIVGLTFLAYLPALSGEFVYDDERFIEKNEAVTHLTAANVLRYFTDPTSQSFVGHDIYRPLRTLDFAIDWAIAPGRPWLFHLESILYHIVACLLLHALLRRLGIDGPAALLGTLFFALHPVNVETVAWITSRGDVLLLIFFLLALIFHVSERRKLALLALFLALLSKEVAVMFPAAVLIVDLYRRADLRSTRRWAWYGAYGALCLVYLVVWFELVAGGEIERTAHMAGWWGDNYALNVLTMSKGFLHYLRVLVFPVNFTIDYRVPTSVGFGVGEIVALVVVIAVAVWAYRAGPRSRLALFWFLVTLLPASNLVRPIRIPTAERFLYVPLVGVALWAGPVLLRGRRLAWVLLGCFLVLTFARSVTWSSKDRLFQYALDTNPGPLTLSNVVYKELTAAHEEWEKRSLAPPGEKEIHQRKMARHAEAVIAYTDRMMALYRDVVRKDPGEIGANTLSQKSNALYLLGRPEEAVEVAYQALRIWSPLPDANYNAALALRDLGRIEEAAVNLTAAYENGPGYKYLRPAVAECWVLAGRERESKGDRKGALDAYRKAWAILPDRGTNRAAREAIQRLR